MKLAWKRRPAGTTTGLQATYKSILVPVAAGTSEAMMATAGLLAASRNAIIEAITVLELPMELSLDAPLAESEEKAMELLEHMRSIAERYGARVITYIVRGRRAGQAIVEEAERGGVEVIIMAASTRQRTHRRPLGETVEYVTRHAPCRLILSLEPVPDTASPEAPSPRLT
jgi:nucleotide-binding universal stress UspA family protein